jgi:hypothetical protein
MTDRAMHVEAFGRVLTDAGSIPAASTISQSGPVLASPQSSQKPFKKKRYFKIAGSNVFASNPLQPNNLGVYMGV